MNKILWVIGLSCLSSALYRIGGIGGFKNAKAIRRFGCSLIFAISCLILGFYSPYLPKNIGIYSLTYIFMALALSTYHDYLSPGGNENWLAWWMTGFVYGLSAFPLFWLGIHWYSIAIRAIFLSLTIMWLRERTGKDWLEEIGSGFLFNISVLFLLL